MELLRQREEAALGNRLRPPLHALASLQDPAHELVRLQLLQNVVHGKLGVAVVEPDDHAERDVVLAHRVDERPPELAVARSAPQRPAHRVDDTVERLRDAPDLLHAERPDLRVVACEAEALDRGAGQMPLRPFREHRDACDEVGAGLEVRQRLAVAAAPLVTRANADDAAVLDEQLRRRGLGQDHRAAFLRLCREPAPELRERRDVVALVLHRRRSRDAIRGARGEEVDGLALDRAVERQLVELFAVPEEPSQPARVDHGAREKM